MTSPLPPVPSTLCSRGLGTGDGQPAGAPERPLGRKWDWGESQAEEAGAAGWCLSGFGTQRGLLGPGWGHWSPLGREVSLPYHGVALALQIGGQLGVVVHALVGGIGQVHFGEQVAIVLALMYLLCEGSLSQLLPAAALHGGQCMGGGVVVQFHQPWGARLRPDLCQRAGARVVGGTGWELRRS